MRPAALLFDMDGLLLDSERLALDALLAVATRFGVARSIAHDFYLTLVGKPSAETRARMVEAMPGGTDVDGLDAAWAQLFAERLKSPIPLKPTVGECLTALGGNSYRMAVVTTTRGPAARDHLRRAGIAPCFESVFGGDEVKARKPDPAPYLEAAEALGVRAADCVAFEDSDTGVHAATAAGCRTVQIPDLRPKHRPFPELGQHLAATLREAVEFLRLLEFTAGDSR